MPALDWELLARMEGTLVFYVGVDALGPITATLTALGRDARQPALIVERCGLPEERIVAARLADVAERARQACIEPPAVLMTGPTVAVASAPVRLARQIRSVDAVPDHDSATMRLAAAAGGAIMGLGRGADGRPQP